MKHYSYFSRTIALKIDNKLFHFRTVKVINQEQVAYDIQIAQRTYSDWENDLRKLRTNNLVKLTNYFDIDLKKLKEEIFNISIQNDLNAIALINSPNSKINSTEAIIKIADSLEKLVFLVERLTQIKEC